MRNIEQCHFCKEKCTGSTQLESRRFFLPYFNETVTVPKNIADCGIFRNDVKGIVLRPEEEVNVKTPYNDD